MRIDFDETSSHSSSHHDRLKTGVYTLVYLLYRAQVTPSASIPCGGINMHAELFRVDENGEPHEAMAEWCRNTYDRLVADNGPTQTIKLTHVEGEWALFLSPFSR